MGFYSGKIALITGGASGIGKLMGEMMLEQGLKKLIIWDNNHEALKEVMTDYKKRNVPVSGYEVNVANTPVVINTAEKVLTDEGLPDILINNAGIVRGGFFHEQEHSDIDATMDINSSALMHIALEFLKPMMKRNSGSIVNIGSAAGLLSNPGMAVYAASKWSVLGWSDSIYLEMKKLKKSVHFTTVSPYYISTGMFDGVKSPVLPIVHPKKAARKILKGMQRKKRFVRMPWAVYTLSFVKGILPASWFDFFVGKGFGIYKTMDTFKGRI